jgi:hypothetical protein
VVKHIQYNLFKNTYIIWTKWSNFLKFPERMKYTENFRRIRIKIVSTFYKLSNSFNRILLNVFAFQKSIEILLGIA